jgi:hypothetical protein
MKALIFKRQNQTIAFVVCGLLSFQTATVLVTAAVLRDSGRPSDGGHMGLAVLLKVSFSRTSA